MAATTAAAAAMTPATGEPQVTEFTRGGAGEPDTRGASLVEKHNERMRSTERETTALEKLTALMPALGARVRAIALTKTDWDVDAALALLRSFQVAELDKLNAISRKRKRIMQDAEDAAEAAFARAGGLDGVNAAAAAAAGSGSGTSSGSSSSDDDGSGSDDSGERRHRHKRSSKDKRSIKDKKKRRHSSSSKKKKKDRDRRKRRRGSGGDDDDGGGAGGAARPKSHTTVRHVMIDEGKISWHIFPRAECATT
jgi:hypothetical protein